MKFKRLLAVVLACCICCMVLVLPASAVPLNVPKDFSRFVSDIWDLSDEYEAGQISKSEFMEKFVASMARFGINYASDVTSFKDVLKVIEFCGIDVPDEWKEWFYDNKMGGGGSGGNRDDSELKGYGAILKVYNSKGVLNTVYYGDYGIFRNIKDTQFDVLLKYTHIAKYDYNSGELLSEDDVDSSIAYTHYIPSTNGLRQYLGDWRNSDGSSNDDFTIEFPEKVPPTYDDDTVSDDDLIDFLNDLLENLQMEFPDLSTIEGLLRAILAKLGTLDSDNDNELLSQILTAIDALKNNGETADNSELLKTLEELKSALLFKDDEKTASLAEMLNTLVQNQVRRSDITIDPSLYNQRYALIEAKLLGKFSFISEIKNFVQYAIDSYSNTENSPTITIDLFDRQHIIDFSAFDSSINLIRWVIAAFIYLSYAFVTFRKIPGYINGGDNQ